VGLSGEIRSVNHIEQRISEAAKLGFDSIVVSKYNSKNLNVNKGIRVVAVSKIEEVFRFVFG
jgi:DNA repair protein RadA/Sms